MLPAVSQQKGRNRPGSCPELDPAKHGGVGIWGMAGLAVKRQASPRVILEADRL